MAFPPKSEEAPMKNTPLVCFFSPIKRIYSFAMYQKKRNTNICSCEHMFVKKQRKWELEAKSQRFHKKSPKKP